APLLLLRAELPDRRRGDPDVRAYPRRQPAAAATRELLGENGVMHVVAALAAVLLGVLEPEEAELGHAREHVVGEPARVFPLARVRSQLGLDEAPDRLAQRFVLVGERRRPPRWALGTGHWALSRAWCSHGPHDRTP